MRYPHKSNLIGDPDFAGVTNSAIAFGDVNGDGHEDVVICGSTTGNNPLTQLYFGNGAGEFNPDFNASGNLEDLENGDVILLDVDNDGDLDFLGTGAKSGGTKVTRLFRNNGNNNWQFVNGVPFVGITLGSMAHADIDGDNDLDVVISGQNQANQRVTALYTNDGSGVFTFVSNSGFEAVSNSDLAFADVDGDSDQDLMLTGFSATNQRIANLYLNNGSGVFTLQTGSPFTGVVNSGIDFVDVDGDLDQDLVLTGQDATNQRVAELYTNNGSGTFSMVSSTPFEGVASSSVSHGDVDGDNDQDLAIMGINASNQVSTKIYTNNGSGVYALSTINNTLEGAQNGEVVLRDFNGNGKASMMLCGINQGGTPISQIYLNNDAGRLTNANPQSVGVRRGRQDYADVDGDGDLDCMVIGQTGNNTGSAQLFLNNGTGAFELDTLNSFQQLYDGSASFADIDGDNDQDLLLCGSTIASTNGSGSTSLYLNNGNGVFTAAFGTGFPNLYGAYTDFADIDGDSDMDLLMVGQSPFYTTALFVNNGNGTFTEDTTITIPDYANGHFLFEDLDADNDLDLVIMGRQSNPFISTSKLFTNNGTGTFTEVTSVPFVGGYYGDIAAGDLDGDNDKDVIIAGLGSNGSFINVFQNDGLGNFATFNNHGLFPLSRGGLEVNDVDGDGDLDVAMAGNISTTSSVSRVAVIMENNGAGFFSQVQGFQLRSNWWGDLTMFDFDGDADKDLLLTGNTFSSNYITSFYRNTSQTCFPPVLNPASLTNLSVCAGQPLTLQLDSTSSLNGATNWSVYQFSCNGTLITNSNSNTITFTPSSGQVNFHIRAEGGCIASPGQCYPFSVTQTPPPQLNPGSSQTVCLGDSVHLNATGSATSYVWSNGVSNGSGFPTTTVGTQVLNVTATDNLGCSNLGQLSVTVNPLPMVQAGSDQQVCQGVSTTLNATGANTYTWSHGVPNNTPFAPAPVGLNDYVVTGQDANGCSNTDTVIIEVFAAPTLIAGSNQSICLGDSVTLSATSNGTVGWSGGIQNGMPFAPGATGSYTYVATASNANNCSTVDSVTVAVDQVLASIQNGTNGLVASPAGATYQWIDCQTMAPVSGATGQVYLPAMSGDYAVVASQGNCSDTSACFNFIGVGVEEAFAEQLLVSPNPSQGWVKLIAEGLSLEGAHIQVMNSLGQVVYQVERVASETLAMDLSQMEKGIYFIRVQRNQVPVGMIKLILQ